MKMIDHNHFICHLILGTFTEYPYACHFAFCSEVDIISHIIKTINFYSIVFEQVTDGIAVVVLGSFVLDRYSCYAARGKRHSA